MPGFNDIADAKKAIEGAEEQYSSADPQRFKVQINDEEVWVSCNKPYRADRIDFGLPAMWPFTGNTQELAQWWLDKHGTNGRFLERRYKDDLGFQVNLQLTAVGKPLFNFHLTVP